MSDKTATKGPPKDAPVKFKMTGAYTKNNMTVSLEWKYPTSATSDKSANRWSGLVLYMAVDTNTEPNKTKKSKLTVGTKGYSKWKGKGKKKKLKAVDETTGKVSGDYKDKKSTSKVATVSSGATTTVVMNQRLFKGVKKTKYSKVISLTSYYPTNTKLKLDAVICKLQGYNKYSVPPKKGTDKAFKKLKNTDLKFNANVPWALYQISLSNPNKPAVETTYIADERKVNFKCTASQPGGGKHWFRTDWTLVATRYEINSKGKNEYETGNRLDDKDSSGTLEFNKTFSLAAGDLKNMNTKIEVVFSARALGAHGASAWKSDEDTKWIFAYPHQKRVGNIKINGNLVFIPFADETKEVDNTNRYTHRVWLERLPDFMVPERMLLTASDDEWVSQAARASGWEKVGGEFDPSVGSFVRSYSLDKAGVSSPYSRTFYRIGAKNESFDLDEYYVYSNPAPCPGYAKIPKPSDDVIDFLECVPEKNGTSVRVVVAYHVSYQDNLPTSDGCEISWSDDYNSWLSNDPPSTFDMPDLDNLGAERFRVKKPATVSPVSDEMYRYWLIPDYWDSAKKTQKYEELTGTGSGQRSFMFTSKAYIMGLTEGVKYYFRARRYLEETSDLPRLYGPYADYSSNLGYEDAAQAAKQILPATIPENVRLKVEPSVPVGKDLELVWTFEGDGTQTEWELKRYTAADVEEVPATGAAQTVGTTAKTWKLKDTAVGVIAKSSKDAAGYTLIPYDTVYNDDGSVKELGVSEYLEDDVVFFVVGTKTTGDFGYSAPVQVHYVEPPSASLGIRPVLTVQPMTLSLGSNMADCSAIVKVTALDSVTRQAPDGLKTQPEGFVVYSRKFESSELHWTEYSGPEAPSSNSEWGSVPPEYDSAYPDYYKSYEYVQSGITKWTMPEIDAPLSELKALGATAADPILLRFAGTANSVPSAPRFVDTTQAGYSSMNPSAQGWCEKRGVEDNRYYVQTTDTEVSNAHVYYEMCDSGSISTSAQTWTTAIPTYSAANPVYYYCYMYRISDYDNEDRYAWTEVGVDKGLSQLMAAGLYSQSVSVKWLAESAPAYFSNVMLPRSLELWDGARYQVSLILEDSTTKLDSKKPDANGVNRPLTEEFTVSYSRTASTPLGHHVFVFSNLDSMTTTLQITKPPLHVPGDVYDVYRVTPDTITKIGTDISPGQVVQDRFAPYSSNRVSYSNPNEKAVNLRYRVVVRTPDGTEAWRDFLYSLKNPSIRFDWGGVNAPLMEYTSLTIPYNLTYSDTFKKYFEARHHMDDRLPVGFWTTSIDRTSSISTDIIKYDSSRDKEALKSLAGFSGPVFVRRPDGCAYLANVELNSYSVSYNEDVIPVSFNITEIELTSEYMIDEGSYLLEEDRAALTALSIEPAGFYDTLLFELKAQ